MKNDEVGPALKTRRIIRLNRGVRSWLSFAHKTIGLTFGALFVLVGLSGGILVYRDAIDEKLNADLMLADYGLHQNIRPVDEILDAAKSAILPEAKLERIVLPRHANATSIVTYIVETDDLDTYVYEIFVDPYTAKVKGQRLKIHGDDQFSQPFMQILAVFHWTLMLGVNKAYVVGVVGMFMFISIMMGLYLWKPSNGNWRLGLKIKWPATAARINFDVHRATGFYLGSILLISLFTGVAMIFKPVTREVIGFISPVHGRMDFGKSRNTGDQKQLSLAEVSAIADRVFPGGRLHSIQLPTSPTGVYVAGKQFGRDAGMSRTFHNVGIDQYTGAITQIQNRDTYRFGDMFMAWLFPLHTGEFLGEAGRPLFVLLGLTPLILFLTGFLRWRAGSRARRF